MNITMENFKTAKYDVFSIFDDRWGLCTAGTPREYNTMTIGWGTMGTIWGPPTADNNHDGVAEAVEKFILRED